MEQNIKDEITRISKEFAKGMLGDEPIEGTSWMVVDPLSAYLSFCGYENKLHQIPHPIDKTPVLVMEFPDGTKFMPTGKDLISVIKESDNYLWI